MKYHNPFDDASKAIINHITVSDTDLDNAELVNKIGYTLADYVMSYNGTKMAGKVSAYKCPYNIDIIAIVEVDDPTDPRVINTKGIMQKNNYGGIIIGDSYDIAVFLVEKGIFSSGKTGRISRTIQAIIGCYASKVLPNTDIRPYTVAATLTTLDEIVDGITTDESVYKNCAPTEVADCFKNFVEFEKHDNKDLKGEYIRPMYAYLHIYNMIRFGITHDGRLW